MSWNKGLVASTTHWKWLPLSLGSYHSRGLGVCSLSRSRCCGGWAEPCVFYLRVCPEPDPSTSPELLAASWSSADRLPRKRCSGTAGATETEALLMCCFYYFYCSLEALGETGSAGGSCSKKWRGKKKNKTRGNKILGVCLCHVWHFRIRMYTGVNSKFPKCYIYYLECSREQPFVFTN